MPWSVVQVWSCDIIDAYIMKKRKKNERVVGHPPSTAFSFFPTRRGRWFTIKRGYLLGISLFSLCLRLSPTSWDRGTKHERRLSVHPNRPLPTFYIVSVWLDLSVLSFQVPAGRNKKINKYEKQKQNDRRLNVYRTWWCAAAHRLHHVTCQH